VNINPHSAHRLKMASYQEARVHAEEPPEERGGHPGEGTVQKGKKDTL
jgi:hypothetical protein